MVYNKVIQPNKVIFNYFDFYYQKQIIFENFCTLNDTLNLKLLSIIQNTRIFKNNLILTRKVEISKYDFVAYYDEKNDRIIFRGF